MTKTFGQPTPRLEDRDLVCGKGRFVGDIHLPGILHASFVRSPHAHAKIVAIDAIDAQNMAGVVAVFTASEIQSAVTTDRLVVRYPTAPTGSSAIAQSSLPTKPFMWVKPSPWSSQPMHTWRKTLLAW